MNTVIAVLEAAERYWLIGVLLFLAGALTLAAVVEAIEQLWGRK